MLEKLSSESVVVAGPFSFSGSTARIWKLTQTDNQVIKWLVLIPATLILIFAAWCIVAVWYFIVFGLFGLFSIPFGLLMRSRRNHKRTALQHREDLDAIEKQRRP